MTKKVAVIGAGASGLTAIKCCLDEGLEPICYERSDDLGGLWRYTDSAVEGQACVMKSTVINTSKEMMAYSDFPIPKEFPAFMHNTKVLDYFRMYTDHFGLEGYIQYKVEVLHVNKAVDYDQTGRWSVQTRDLKTGKETTTIFDAVFVCTGHHAWANKPSLPGLDEFTGTVTHTHDYKDYHGYEDKRVVVVGIGNSGGDVSVELSRVSKQVFLSTRRGSWVINRVAENGLPVDIKHTSRFTSFLRHLVPRSTLNNIVHARLNHRFDHENFGLKPEHSFSAQHPMVNDDLPNRIICGSVAIKPDVKQFTKTGVEFVDGTSEENIDAVIMATGFVFGFPFLDKSVIDVKNNEVNLYKYVYPPDLKHGTLAVIGCFQPLGAIMPICELQCRWATRVLKGLVHLPGKEVMGRDIDSKRQEMEQQYVKSIRHTIQVDYMDFMCELAELVGCQVNFGKLCLTDPFFAAKLFFGPLTPFQFRLSGPGTWKGAKAAIEGQMERTLYPTRRKPMKPTKRSFLKPLLFLAIFLTLIYYWIL